MEPAAPLTVESGAADFAAALEAFGLRMRPQDAMEFVDQVEERLATFTPCSEELTHVFTPGLYARVCCMPAGMWLTSKIHLTEHQFTILNGVISVWTKETGAVTYVAPYHGVTTPGTRRILYVHEDTRWVTFHPTDKTDLAEIENDLIMKHVNPLLEQKEALL